VFRFEPKDFCSFAYPRDCKHDDWDCDGESLAERANAILEKWEEECPVVHGRASKEGLSFSWDIGINKGS
jgi:hypothetical protein